MTKDIADSVGLNKAEWTIVAEPAEAGSPAARAGINEGDVITAVNGKGDKVINVRNKGRRRTYPALENAYRERRYRHHRGWV